MLYDHITTIMPEEKLKIAMVGLGKWGKKLALGFSKHTNIIYAVNKGSEETHEWIKENLPKAKIEKNLNKVLSDKMVDAVVIATPIETLHDIALKCLEANKDVFIEKPMCGTSKEVDDLILVSEEKGLVVFTGYIFLYDEAYQKMLELIKNQKIEQISFNWQKYGSFGNSIFFNLLSHDLALSIKLLGYPSSVKLLSQKKIQGEINIIDLETKHEDTIVDYHIDRVSETKKKTLRVKTQKKEYLLTENILYEIIDGKEKEIFKSKNTILENEILAFIKNIKEKTIPYSNKELSLDIVKVIEQLI